MAISLITQLIEQSRQQRTQDDKFFKKEPYVFVLNTKPGKGSAGPSGRVNFPMVLNPTRFEYTLPYAMQLTPLQEGGVVAEEAGFVIGELEIEASTGFSLKAPLDNSGASGGGSFTGELAKRGNFASQENLSGQMNLWRLAHRCFDAYSALKKDAETAAETTMEFHSFKDELHLLVVPREFRVSREASRDRVSYRFVARLAVIGNADSVPEIANALRNPDKDIIANIKDAVSTARDTINGLGAAIDDINAAIDDVSRTVSSAFSIITDAVNLKETAEQFIIEQTTFARGVDFIRDFTDATFDAVALLDLTSLPRGVRDSFIELYDNGNALAVVNKTRATRTFEKQSDNYTDLINSHKRFLQSKRTDVQAAALRGSDAVGTLSVEQAFDTGIKPGDAKRLTRPTVPARLNSNEFNGFQERAVRFGETLQSIAAQTLGDARKWIDLSVINQLKAPYITNGANIPRTLQPGGKIIVPIPSQVPSPDTITPGESELGKSQIDKQLGIDLLTTDPDKDGLYDLVIDVPKGSVDAKLVGGIDNLVQAIDNRLRTEKGTNILYPAVGLPRLVGSSSFIETNEEARYRARQELLSDGRIERIFSLSFSVEEDKLFINADVQPIGFSTARTISRVLT